MVAVRGFGKQLAGWLAIAAIVCSAHSAHADARDESRAAFRRGVALAQSGDYTRAKEAFQQAYKLYAHPSILLNLGIALFKTGEIIAAEQDLVKFLADDGGASPDDLASARATLAAARAKLGTVRLRVMPNGARATLDGQPIALVSGEQVDVRAVIGEHSLEAQAEGFSTKRMPITVEGTRVNAIELKLDPVGGLVAPPPTTATSSGGTTKPDDGKTTDTRSTRKTVGWVLLGVAVPLAGVGTYFGLSALSFHGQLGTTAVGSPEHVAAQKSGSSAANYCDAFFAGAVVLGGVGAYLLLTTDTKSASVSAVVGPGLTGVRGTF